MFKLHPKEKIVLEVRKHWFVIFSQGFFLFILAIIPILFLSSFNSLQLQFESIKLNGNGTYLFSFFYFLWLLIIWVSFFILWTQYYLDVWYVTEERIVAIDQRGLFRREIIDFRHEKVQDAAVRTNGIIPTLLDFGTLHVQTAGEKSRIIMTQAKNPNEAKRVILLHHSKSIEGRGSEHHILE